MPGPAKGNHTAVRTTLTKNLCIGALIEAVRDRTKTVDLKQVNAVLLQPHWRHNQQNEPVSQGIVFTNQPPASQSP